MEGDLPFLLCFALYLTAISEYKPPGGLIFGGPIKRRVFCVTSFFFFFFVGGGGGGGGLVGGAYTWKGLFSEFYGGTMIPERADQI